MVFTLPLNDEHIKLGAKMVDFAGYSMPIQYPQGILTEHKIVRESVGLFDISHMGEFLITGKDSESFLQSIMTNDLKLMLDGKAQYACMCYENGTVVDDCFYYRYNPEMYRLIVNASNKAKDEQWLNSHKNNFKIKIENLSDQRGRFALQGPNALKTLSALISNDLTKLQRFFFLETKIETKIKTNIKSIPIFIARTGYTGEDGFEISFSIDDSLKVWQLVLDAGKKHNISPIGLGARDTLRLEACYSLYGHEINDHITPIEANISFCVKDKPVDFIGKKVLMEQKKNGVPRKSVGLELIEKGIMREHYNVYDLEEKEIGYITSGTFSPTLNKSIALALLKTEYTNIGTEILVDIRGKKMKAKTVKTPFYTYQGK
jgi:aminomethyltransferase